MIEREWIDVEDWNLRHLTPGAGIREASWGGVETDANGAVIRVAGRQVTGKILERDVDPGTGEQIGPGRLVPTALQGEHPTRETLLAHGYEDRAVFPLDESDAERDVPQSKAQTQVEPERKTAETTHVEPQDRRVTVEQVEDPGEMGAPVDVEGGLTATETEETEGEGYKSPFTEAPPAGTSASDPAYNPPEGAPAGEQVEDLVAEGRAEVLDDSAKLRKLLGGGGA